MAVTALLILDGFGIGGSDPKSNAILAAGTPQNQRPFPWSMLNRSEDFPDHHILKKVIRGGGSLRWDPDYEKLTGLN